MSGTIGAAHRARLASSSCASNRSRFSDTAVIGSAIEQRVVAQRVQADAERIAQARAMDRARTL